jgi:serine/threonine-protein kinase
LDCLDEDEVLAFAQGELGSQRRLEVIAHVDSCEPCGALTAAVARETTPKEDEEPQVTLVDGRYEIRGMLGRGATATVFRAHDQKLGIDVALKMVRRSRDTKGFMRELKVGRRITDPNVCRLYDANGTEDFDYITMELVDGETLAEVLVRGELAQARALAVLDAVAAGLSAAHERGIVHRDLKPANVMIERATERVVLMDFGFAMDLDVKESKKLVGTPSYWSPEQARGESATAASDVYSFGVLAFRLLAGRDFRLSDDEALDDVPRRFRRVVARCVASRPSDRFRNAAEARRALSRAGGAGRYRVEAAASGAIAIAVVALGWLARAPSSPSPSPSPVSPSPPSLVTSVSPEPATVAPPAPRTEPAAVPAVSVSTAVPIAPTLPSKRAVIPQKSARLPVPTAPSAAPAESDILYVK